MAGVATLSVTPSTDLRAAAPRAAHAPSSWPVLLPVGTTAVICVFAQLTLAAGSGVPSRHTVPPVPKP